MSGTFSGKRRFSARLFGGASWIRFILFLNGREKMKRGFIYRLGILIKEAGEIAGHKGRIYASLLVNVGLGIRRL